MADGFEDLDRSIADYVREVPMPIEREREDVECFLQWLAGRDDVSEEQRDFIVCQRAWQAVEIVALARRLAHARFQMALSQNGRLAAELESNRRLLVHLNPVRVWATLETHALLADGEAVPATVLFFPVGDEVRTVVARGEVRQMVQILAHGPRTVKQIAQRMDALAQRVIDLVAELAQLGLVAFGG